MTDIVRKSSYDELSGKMIQEVIYDNSDIIAVNEAQKQDRSSLRKYQGNLVHAARVHMGDVDRLKAMGYDLLSPDPAEVRRALCYLQANEQKLLTVEGKPFAMHRQTWV